MYQIKEHQNGTKHSTWLRHLGKDNQGIKALQKANKTLLNLQKEVYLTENIESYIYFYNYKRIHSVIGYITPAQKMAELKKVA